MFSNQKVPNGESLDLSSIGLINVVPHFCPGVRKVFFGHWQSSNGSIPHSLCDEDAYFDAKVSYFSYAKIYTTFFWPNFQILLFNQIYKKLLGMSSTNTTWAPFRCWKDDFRRFFISQNMHHLRLIKDIGRIRLGHSIS